MPERAFEEFASHIPKEKESTYLWELYKKYRIQTPKDERYSKFLLSLILNVFKSKHFYSLLIIN